MQCLPEGWQQRFYEVYERARQRELARYAADDQIVVADATGLGALLAMIRNVLMLSHGLTHDQYLALSDALLAADHEIRRRIEKIGPG